MYFFGSCISAKRLSLTNFYNFCNNNNNNNNNNKLLYLHISKKHIDSTTVKHN